MIHKNVFCFFLYLILHSIQDSGTKQGKALLIGFVHRKEKTLPLGLGLSEFVSQSSDTWEIAVQLELPFY